jgi:hypothetical protein
MVVLAAFSLVFTPPAAVLTLVGACRPESRVRPLLPVDRVVPIQAAVSSKVPVATKASTFPASRAT